MKNQGCGICGGTMALIRGRYPKEDKRWVCPTCLCERMEQIREVAGENYGKCFSALSQDKKEERK